MSNRFVKLLKVDGRPLLVKGSNVLAVEAADLWQEDNTETKCTAVYINHKCFYVQEAPAVVEAKVEAWYEAQ